MLDSLLVLKRAAEQREESDTVLLNWWLTTFVLTILTLGLYMIYIIYKRIERRDKHFNRISRFINATIECTEEYAKKISHTISAELKLVKEKYEEFKHTLAKPKGAGIWIIAFIVTSIFSTMEIPTLGILGSISMLVVSFCILYFLTVDWFRLQKFEREIIADLNLIWIKLGLTQSPIQIREVVPERNFSIYLFLSIITFGIWGFIWDYAMHNDPHRLFEESKRWETEIVEMFSQASSPTENAKVDSL